MTQAKKSSAKKQVPEAVTAYAKFQRMLEEYEKILHPDCLNPLRYGLAAVFNEMKEQAFIAAKISPEAQEIEQVILQVKGWKDRSSGSPSSFYYKMAYKKILEIFKK